jgi:hypothetical protein
MNVDVAPLRISDKPGHDTVSVHVSNPAAMQNVRCVFGSDVRDGQVVANLGAVCGLSRCGAPGVMPLAAVDVELAFDYADTGGPPDGDYALSVHAISEPDGWQ